MKKSELLKALESEPLLLKNPTEWANLKAKTKSSLGKDVLKRAELWAKTMQVAIKTQNLTIAEAASKTISKMSFLSDNEIIYDSEVILGENWLFGTELKTWAEEEMENISVK